MAYRNAGIIKMYADGLRKQLVELEGSRKDGSVDVTIPQDAIRSLSDLKAHLLRLEELCGLRKLDKQFAKAVDLSIVHETEYDDQGEMINYSMVCFSWFRPQMQTEAMKLTKECRIFVPETGPVSFPSFGKTLAFLGLATGTIADDEVGTVRDLIESACPVDVDAGKKLLGEGFFDSWDSFIADLIELLISLSGKATIMGSSNDARLLTADIEF